MTSRDDSKRRLRDKGTRYRFRLMTRIRPLVIAVLKETRKPISGTKSTDEAND